MTLPQGSYFLDNDGVALRVREFGPADGCPVVILHGLRDHSIAFEPLAMTLAEHAGYRVLLPCLRGHGDSDKPGAYAMPHFLMDLHTVVEHAGSPACALIGHSLGGHIVAKFAALFPRNVSAVVVIEGLGPPASADEDSDQTRLEAYRTMLTTRMRRSAGTRPIRDLDDVAARLERNNPRMTQALARTLAPHLAVADASGLRWNFDSRASSVFIGASREFDSLFWRQVQAPTCIVSGALAHEYWATMTTNGNASGVFRRGRTRSARRDLPTTRTALVRPLRTHGAL